MEIRLRSHSQPLPVSCIHTSYKTSNNTSYKRSYKQAANNESLNGTVRAPRGGSPQPKKFWVQLNLLPPSLSTADVPSNATPPPLLRQLFSFSFVQFNSWRKISLPRFFLCYLKTKTFSTSLTKFGRLHLAGCHRLPTNWRGSIDSKRSNARTLIAPKVQNNATFNHHHPEHTLKYTSRNSTYSNSQTKH